MKLSLKILESDREIAKGLLKVLLPDITKDFNSAVRQISTELPGIINSIVTNTEEYSSLLSGQLKYDLGIPDAGPKIAGLIDTWVRGIVIDPDPPRIINNQIKASISASAFKVDFSDVLQLSEARVYDYVRRYDLPWLEWLLFYGTAPIITGFDVVYMKTSRSRTGGAVMRTGDSWSVPQEFAGTIQDNWITRSIKEHEKEIMSLLERVL